MRLRVRLALTASLVALPAAGFAGYLRYTLEWDEAEAELIAFAQEELYERGVLERILHDPRRFPMRGGPGLPPNFEPPRGPRRRPGPPEPPPPAGERIERGLFAYGPDFESENPRVPAMPAEVRQALEGGATSAATVVDLNGPVFAVGWRTPESEGPATWILATSSSVPTLFRWPIAAAMASITVILIAALLAALGPVVSRARRLASAVDGLDEDPQRSIPIEGADELTEVARAIQSAHAATTAARSAAETRERALRTFVENTAHDVGTPLTVLQAHLSELARQAPGPHADAAVQEAQYLSSLLGNLAAVARLEDEASSLRQDAVDLAALADRVVGRHGYLARERSIELEHALPAERVEVRGEVTLLEQALGNLVHNGIRHGRSGGHVTVHLALLESDRFRLRVLDDGPGVPASERARLGERRWRAEEARQRNPDGRGLGVAITRDVLDRHGWTLSFHGEEGEGLEARIEGPLSKAAS